MSKHAAITIVSKNYFSLAATLAESYRRHHPGHEFLIVLVDRSEGYCPDVLTCGAEVVEIERLLLPDAARFIYRYSIMELNTAVKPYALADLFESRGYDTLLYIDPDILIYRPLDEVYSALGMHSIVLIPHIRRPFHDGANPSDLGILQSGTYNLGFIGLRRGASVRSLLAWWMEKLYRDCVVDIPNGLFVDQKWIDLVPGFYEDTCILRDEGYNVAYWNLHERRIWKDEYGCRMVNDRPLVFFHFSGFSPFAPHLLSKHQDRHQLEPGDELTALTEDYADLLMQAGYADSSLWPYAFERLGNGVKLPLQLVRDVMQWATRNGVSTPDPLAEPDAFCNWLMSRGSIPEAPPDGVLLFHFLLRRRPDVCIAFPGVEHNHNHPDFRRWFITSGEREEGLADLLGFEQAEAPLDHVAHAFTRLRSAGRQDVIEYFGQCLDSAEDFDRFCDWFTIHGWSEMQFDLAYTARFKAARAGACRIFDIYFLRGDLQRSFTSLWRRDEIEALATWLRRNRHHLELNNEEISLFVEWAEARKDMLEKQRFLYQHFGLPSVSTPNVYSAEQTWRYKRMSLDLKELMHWLCSEATIEPIDHFCAEHGDDAEVPDDFRQVSLPHLGARENFEFISKLRQNYRDRYSLRQWVNVAGFSTAPTGMGESSRSMLATLTHLGMPVKSMRFPSPVGQLRALPSSPVEFGWPSSQAEVSITVANADSAALVESFLPRIFWARRDVGFWVWETEQLPERLRPSQALFDEIWTPSEYSAAAIRRTISKPVHVLPHTIDFEALRHATSRRERFGLPRDAVLFGFAFDPASVLERKNISGLLRAFEQAFAAQDKCFLVLKVNGNGIGGYEYDQIMSRATSDRVIVIRDTLTHAETLDFIHSLDVYVSLHRSEGFGLTCAEAMGMGIPVIASGYSGNLDFMSDENSLLVPTRVIETERPYGPYPAGTRWGDPDIEAAAALMRSLLDEGVRRDVGERGARSVVDKLSLASVGSRAAGLLSALGVVIPR